jgi:hypothetical protein
MAKAVWIGISSAVLAMAAVTTLAVSPASAAGKRSYATGRFAMQIDGATVHSVHKATGGSLGRRFTQKLSHEPLTVELGVGVGKPMWDWIQASFDKGYVPRSMSASGAGADYKITTIRQFEHALITEVTFPTLDGSSKEPGYFTVQIDPQTIRYQKPSGTIDSTKQVNDKKWLASNFRLEIGDLPCERVAKIDSFKWTQKVVRNERGEFEKPTKLGEPSNLQLTIDVRDRDAWAKWHRQLVASGEAHDDHEKTGSLTFLGPDLDEELMTLRLDHIGILSLERTPTSSKDELARFVVELYVEKMTIDFGG